jgi:hypothetical protein
MRFRSPQNRQSERGITILIVGITLLALVGMAALAIDVASLYEARSEAQRSADAAALAAARIFVTSSYTSTTDSAITIAQVCAAATTQALAAAQLNPIAGQPASLKNNPIQCDPSNRQNPRVTVTVRTASAPTFFARIWGGSTSTITATATAEAYNASGQTLPIEITNVKPWFIPNCDPGGPAGPCNGSNGFFVNPGDGSINYGNAFVGQILHLTRQTTIGGTVGGDGGGRGMGSTLSFYGLRYPVSPAPAYPPTGAVSCNDPNINNGDTYIDNIAGTSSLPMACGMLIGPTGSPVFQFEAGGPPGGPTVIGTKCLIHASGPGNSQGQDEFSTGVPVRIDGGSNNPNLNLQHRNISRSDSVVTAPLFDGRQMDNSSAPAPIVGFLQLAVQETNLGGFGGGQLLDAVVVNVVGCNPSLSTTTPISASGSSPIPVRLVQRPSTP